MGKRRTWTHEELRTIFNLRLQGTKIGDIAGVMGTSTWTIGKILHRKKAGDIPLDVELVAKVRGTLQSTKRANPVNPVMPQAMRKADPAYIKTPAEHRADSREPAATLDDVGLIAPKPVITKAQALQSVLKHVELANSARAQVVEAKLLVSLLQKDAKRIEDEAFTYIGELKERGFASAFLSSFLDECGLCTDGLFVETEKKKTEAKAEV